MHTYEDAIQAIIDEFNYEFSGIEDAETAKAAIRSWKMACRIVADIYGVAPNKVKSDYARAC